MASLGVFLLLVWLACVIFNVAAASAALVLKIALFLLVVGIIFDALSHFSVYSRWRK